MLDISQIEQQEFEVDVSLDDLPFENQHRMLIFKAPSDDCQSADGASDLLTLKSNRSTI
jgi:hypothetical protein